MILKNYSNILLNSLMIIITIGSIIMNIGILLSYFFDYLPLNEFCWIGPFSLLLTLFIIILSVVFVNVMPIMINVDNKQLEFIFILKKPIIQNCYNINNIKQVKYTDKNNGINYMVITKDGHKQIYVGIDIKNKNKINEILLRNSVKIKLLKNIN